MKKYFTLNRIFQFTLGTLIIIQFFRIDKTVKPVNIQTDILALTQPSADISTILKTSCYDCHSNQPVYPWYTNVAPLSWWIKHHINEGSHHLNFSEWGTYSLKRKDHKLEECVEMIEEGEMPMSSYTIMHGEAKLSQAQKILLIDWFKAERTKLSYAQTN